MKTKISLLVSFVAAVALLVVPLRAQQGLSTGQRYYDLKGATLDVSGGSILGANQLGGTTTALYVVTVQAADGALAILNGMTVITKAGVLAGTLAAPVSGGQDGLELIIMSTTANAHVVTATSLIQDGATGAPHTTMTFAAFPGASITLIAYAGKWYVQSKNAVTVT